jgi:hypothetical protein
LFEGPDIGWVAESSWSQHMIAQELQGKRANGLSEKTNFGAKIALSQLIDGAARRTYSGTQVIRGPCFLDA